MNNDQLQNNTTQNNPAIAPAPAVAPAANIPAAQSVSSLTAWPGAFGIYKLSKQSVMLNIGTILILFIGNAIFQTIGNIKFENQGIELLVFIFTIFISVVYSATMTIVWLAGIKNEKISLSQTFNKSKDYLVRVLVSSLLLGLATIASLLLFIIPFFFVFPRLLFTTFLIIDKNMGAVDAFSASWSMSKGHVGKIYGIIGATFAMLLLSITIIGIPFSLYFIVMYSAAFTLLYAYTNNTQPLAVLTAAPAAPAPVASVPTPQVPTAGDAVPAVTPPQASPTEPPTAPQA